MIYLLACLTLCGLSASIFLLGCFILGAQSDHRKRRHGI